MSVDLPRAGFRGLAVGLSPEQEDRLVAALNAEEAEGVEGDWASWAHRGQFPPAGDWRAWVLMGGRGFGKTRAGAEWVAALAREARPAGDPLRIALVAASIDEARRVMIEGESGLIAVAGEEIERWYPTRRLLRFASGAEAVLFSGSSPDALRGPQHHYAWCDEMAKWEHAKDAWDMLQLGLRLGERPRALITTTPGIGAVLRAIMDEPDTVTSGGATYRNPHLPRAFVRRVEALFAGTRRGRAELDGELLPDAAGALWTVAMIMGSRIPPRSGEGDHCEAMVERGLHERVACDEPPPSGLRPATSPCRGGFVRTLIAVDPPSGDGTCGIVACARDREGLAHVLADHSVSGRSPEGWARAVADAAALHGTREVVAEANQGGRMVKAVLMAADAGLHVRLVNARQGKTIRAEPVAQLFEAGKARLHGRMAALEAELLGMIAGGGYEGPGRSPDRADAMVWGVTEVMRERVVRVRGM